MTLNAEQLGDVLVALMADGAKLETDLRNLYRETKSVRDLWQRKELKLPFFQVQVTRIQRDAEKFRRKADAHLKGIERVERDSAHLARLELAKIQAGKTKARIMCKRISRMIENVDAEIKKLEPFYGTMTIKPTTGILIDDTRKDMNEPDGGRLRPGLDGAFQIWINVGILLIAIAKKYRQRS